MSLSPADNSQVIRGVCVGLSKKSYKRGVCRPLEEESSFCLGLSTRPVSEIVPVCLNPRFLVLITLL